jgi:cyclase
MRRILLARVGAALLLGASLVAPATAQPVQPAAPEPLTAELVKTGLYVISGSGANTLVRFSASGLMLVDGKRSGSYRALMSEVRKLNRLSDLPVRVLIVTAHDDAHAGTIAEFAKAGVPVVAQDNAKRRLEGAEGGPPAKALVGYRSEYAIRMGGVEARLVHFGAARTDGDTAVYFPNLKVVAIGDLFTTATPHTDFASGGSLVNWSAVLGQVLALDWDVAVPAAGPPVTRAAVAAFRLRLDGLIARATELAATGIAPDALAAQLRAENPQWALDLTGTELERFYAEVRKTR